MRAEERAGTGAPEGLNRGWRGGWRAPALRAKRSAPGRAAQGPDLTPTLQLRQRGSDLRCRLLTPQLEMTEKRSFF